MSDLLADALQEGDKTYAMFLEKINWNRISTIFCGAVRNFLVTVFYTGIIIQINDQGNTTG